jgi:hypothetical protein
MTDGTDAYAATATSSDPNGDTRTYSAPVNPGGDFTIDPNTGAITWTPPAPVDSTDYSITLRVTDVCGAFDECTYQIRVVLETEANLEVEGGYNRTDTCFNPGDLVYVPIKITQLPVVAGQLYNLGGFELHLDFEYTSMTFVGMERGELIPAPTPTVPGFESFYYRLLPCPSCGCCKYKILIFGMYDMPDGRVGTPIDDIGVLLWLKFVINNDENLRGLNIPICWQWTPCELNPPGGDPFDPDCGENTFSSEDGNILFVSSDPDQFNPLCCDDPGSVEDLIDFGNPCFYIPICGEGPGLCKRGDVNMNTVTYEVADAVLFASYFVQGIGVFGGPPDDAYKICATDVNADGRALTLSDLVYLIRVILHDAVEIPKLAPSTVANVIVYNGVITVEGANVGAILFEFDGAVNPTLLAANMEMINKDNKVLVWSQSGNSIENVAEVLSYTGDAKLTSVTAVDRDTRELTTTITSKAAPTTFALHQAYPNPFNPFTNLSFTLPEAASYSMKIYNVAGQLVRAYDGTGAAGLNVITWNGKDNAGNDVSSGVYFFKLIAGKYSATEKMVMMK